MHQMSHQAPVWLIGVAEITGLVDFRVFCGEKEKWKLRLEAFLLSDDFYWQWLRSEWISRLRLISFGLACLFIYVFLIFLSLFIALPVKSLKHLYIFFIIATSYIVDTCWRHQILVELKNDGINVAKRKKKSYISCYMNEFLFYIILNISLLFNTSSIWFHW